MSRKKIERCDYLPDDVLGVVFCYLDIVRYHRMIDMIASTARQRVEKNWLMCSNIQIHDGSSKIDDAWHSFDGRVARIIVTYDAGNTITTYEWYYYGRLHRFDDLPARVIRVERDRDVAIRKEWWSHGFRHRNGDRPAIIVGKMSRAKKFIPNTWSYYSRGVHHRSNDKPADIYIAREMGNMIRINVWFVNGEIHRANNKPAHVFQANIRKPKYYSPAIELPNYVQTCRCGVIYHDWVHPIAVEQPTNYTKVTIRRWFHRGDLHRVGGRPAQIKIYVSPNTVYKLYSWFLQGALHRVGDRPAVIIQSVTPHFTKVERKWYILGKLHRYNNQPAVVTNTGDCDWYVYGRHFRSDHGPIAIHSNRSCMWNKFDRVTSCYIWWHTTSEKLKDYLIDRTAADVPYVQHSKYTTRWFLHGFLHRVDGPAIIRKDGGYEWWYMGMLHRDCGEPAIHTPNSLVWYRWGIRHCPYGPAVIRFPNRTLTTNEHAASDASDACCRTMAAMAKRGIHLLARRIMHPVCDKDNKLHASKQYEYWINGKPYSQAPVPSYSDFGWLHKSSDF